MLMVLNSKLSSFVILSCLIRFKPLALWQQILLLILINNRTMFQNIDLDNFYKLSLDYSKESTEILNINLELAFRILDHMDKQSLNHQ